MFLSLMAVSASTLELNATIPEGELGLNPGGMSQSDKIDIIHTFKKPSGMQ